MSLNKTKVLRTAEKYVLQGKIPAAIDEYRKVVDADAGVGADQLDRLPGARALASAALRRRSPPAG